MAKGKLTDAAVRQLRARATLYRVTDGAGLCAEVHPSGAVYWRLRYRHAGKAKMAGLGRYPEVSLAEARRAADALRAQVRAGVDPVAAKREAKREQAAAAANTLEAVAADWLTRNPGRLAAVTLGKARAMLDTYALSALGRRPLADITPPEVLDVLRRPERDGKHETAHRLQSTLSRVFRWGIATGVATTDPTRDLRGALVTRKEQHRAAIVDPVRVGELLRRIDDYHGEPVTRAALQLSALTFVRPGELRAALWAEIDLDAALWTIAGARMKGRHLHADTRPDHLVPLSRQAVVILRELRRLTGRCKLVFPGRNKPSRPLSENTVTAALKAMGYAGEQTAHGFRSIASTLLREQGHDPVLIEAQLAHSVGSKVEAAYNRAQYLDRRRAMMQAWADYLDGLRGVTRHAGEENADGTGT